MSLIYSSQDGRIKNKIQLICRDEKAWNVKYTERDGINGGKQWQKAGRKYISREKKTNENKSRKHLVLLQNNGGWPPHLSRRTRKGRYDTVMQKRPDGRTTFWLHLELDKTLFWPDTIETLLHDSGRDCISTAWQNSLQFHKGQLNQWDQARMGQPNCLWLSTYDSASQMARELVRSRWRQRSEATCVHPKWRKAISPNQMPQGHSTFKTTLIYGVH